MCPVAVLIERFFRSLVLLAPTVDARANDPILSRSLGNLLSLLDFFCSPFQRGYGIGKLSLEYFRTNVLSLSGGFLEPVLTLV